MSKLKVASVQLNIKDGAYEENMALAKSLIEEISNNEKNVDLILFHECCLEGMDSDSYDNSLTEEVRQTIIHFWKDMARLANAYIIAGHVAFIDNQWENHASCFSPDGEIISQYAKTHLYCGEREVMREGKSETIFQIKDFNIGYLICADLGFPELSRKMARSGVDLFVVPSCWAYPHFDLWLLCNRLRAAENSAYLLSSNRIGNECTGRVLFGHSMLVSPMGEVLASLGEQENTYFTYTIEKDYPSSSLTSVGWLDWIRDDLY